MAAVERSVVKKLLLNDKWRQGQRYQLFLTPLNFDDD